MANEKKCILYDNKICDRCMECEMCDLDPSKVCDNCEKCMHMDDNYNVMELDMYGEVDDDSVLDDPEVFRQMNEDSEEDWLSDFYGSEGSDDDDTWDDDEYGYDDDGDRWTDYDDEYDRYDDDGFGSDDKWDDDFKLF